MAASTKIPTPHGAAARQAALAFWREGHILAALQALHDTLGDIFALPLPGFRSVVVVGPDANRLLLADAREHFLWRSETDPVTRLLRQGLLVVDGPFHDDLRQRMTPALHRSLFDGFIETMVQSTDRVVSGWGDGVRLDVLAEARRIALLIVTNALFGEDIGPDLNRLVPDIVRAIRYISPGPWLLWPGIPRPGYQRALRNVDAYLRRLIAHRRAHPGAATDLLGRLIASGMRDDLIRDQLLTMLIAGHDTSTALLAWTLLLLATHPAAMQRVQAEIDAVVGTQMPSQGHLRQLAYLDCVVKETLRLYPPIHLGSRVAATDIDFRGYRIPAGTRVLYSIYLTHRDRRYWPDPQRFDPERFSPERSRERVAYTFLPFGGGPRNCIGAAFAQVEAKVVLARILQRVDFRFVGSAIRPRMRATLEPSSRARVEVCRRDLEHRPSRLTGDEAAPASDTQQSAANVTELR
jgi:cytochrome P450